MIHFIFKVTLKLDYLPETAFIAVSFFDRYIAKNNVRVLKQQRLLALTCIFIAGKIHEELSEPLISEILEFNDSLFSANCLKVCLSGFLMNFEPYLLTKWKIILENGTKSF